MKTWFLSIRLPMAKPDDKKALRQFALQMGIAFPVIFAVVLPWLFDDPIPLWPFAITFVLFAAATILPVLLYPAYVMWIFVASILGWMNTQLILALVFFLLILPLGLVLRVTGKLSYRDKQSNNDSYWIARERPPKAENLKEPF
ncbi:SxtJ family membrane protein [Alteromonas facilis]|uniref:SxtJ family membrane protein n=1 Tax=Alteromonas facilis TaxID=2048004 RepID=UPI000C290318|nr:SxtJ family membrane protein [Alteromonas facilis]